MRKIYLFLLVCTLTLFSCQDDNNDLLPEDEATSIEATFELSKGEVEKLLSDFIKSVKPNVNTRAGGQFKILDSKKTYTDGIPTRSVKDSKVTFYEYNLEIEGERNHAMICADKRLPMVVSFIKGNMPLSENSVSTASEREVAHINGILRSYEEDFNTILAERTELPDPFNHYWNISFPGYGEVKDLMYSNDRDEVYFLTTVTWDQGNPYNSGLDTIPYGPIDPATGHTKKYSLGCVNVALLNLMARNSVPNTLDWRTLTLTPVVSNWHTPLMIKSVANLCKDVYRYTNSKTNPETGATGTTVEGLYAGMDSVGLKAAPIYKGFNIEVIKSSLQYARPVIMAANDKAGIADVGHAYIVKGWWKARSVYPSPWDMEVITESLAIGWGYSGGFGDGWYCAVFAGLGFENGIKLSPITLDNEGNLGYTKIDWTKDIHLISHVARKNAYIPPLPAPLN